jgi:uncharacterized membrane protein YjjP (DUF1212 family)
LRANPDTAKQTEGPTQFNLWMIELQVCTQSFGFCMLLLHVRRCAPSFMDSIVAGLTRVALLPPKTQPLSMQNTNHLHLVICDMWSEFGSQVGVGLLC